MLMLSRSLTSIDPIHRCRGAPVISHGDSPPVLATPTLLSYLWEATDCPAEDNSIDDEDDIPLLQVAAETSNLLHVRVCGIHSSNTLSRLASNLPSLTTLECVHHIFSDHDEMDFRAPRLRHLLLWDCTMKQADVKRLLHGAPNLRSLAIGGTSTSISVPLYTPTPSFNSELRWLSIDMGTRSLTETVGHWAIQTRFTGSVVTLRLKCFAWISQQTIWALFGICMRTLETLDIVFHDTEFDDIDPYDPLHFELQSLKNLTTVRFMCHVGLLPELIGNILDIQSPIIKHVELHIVMYSDVARDVASPEAPRTSIMDSDDEAQGEGSEDSHNSDDVERPPPTLANQNLFAIRCLDGLDALKRSHTLERLDITFVMQNSDLLPKREAWRLFRSAVRHHLPGLVAKEKIWIALQSESEFLQSFNDCQINDPRSPIRKFPRLITDPNLRGCCSIQHTFTSNRGWEIRKFPRLITDPNLRGCCYT
ncbi:hypothetical protein BDZ89DRAFT_1047502 [Hymenopellis radicata]|nr:hypothetical protein BDZ89DRAFT_1047502 [Hymenopellis radicata]